MVKILCRTKGNANPKGKPRVYFTCHPEDSDRYFDKICQDIFKTHDCAIFYTEDMTAVIAEQDKATDLESNNLFVVPVTFRLLSQPNRAMDSDIPFALQKHIPVLPFMMEPGIDEFYAQKFGELQYLNPYSTDITEISYEEKLKKYLESVLISDEMAKRVRAAFDAYIFLSYRKKDRRYANELMRLIHSHPECRDIAIWYDEFLTPGESFRENIERVLNNSKLFALLVTPNLLEEPDGKPNFVMGKEYPAAKRSGITILPAEMEETDKSALGEKFKDIPLCADPHDAAFKARLLESLSRIATAANNEDPMHNYLIGLAYLDGIDVEIDRKRGLALITSAADADLPEAMEKLFLMYNEGTGVSLNYREAAKWAEHLWAHYQKAYGQEHPETLTWLNNLASTCGSLGEHKKALDLNRETYELRCRVLGEEHPDTLTSLNNLAYAYGELGDYKNALDLNKKAYAIRCRVLGEESSDTLLSLNNLASTYSSLGNHKKSLELAEKVYAVLSRTLGEEHPHTIVSLNNMAVTHGKLGDHQKELELMQKVYAIRCRTSGEGHPDTLTSLNNVALAYSDLEDYKTALELTQKVYTVFSRILGEEHPDTLLALNNLAYIYIKLEYYKKAQELSEKAYALRLKALGEAHPATLTSLGSVVYTCLRLGDRQKAVELAEKLYTIRLNVSGEEDPDALSALANFAYACSKVRDYRKEIELREKLCELWTKQHGEEHADTFTLLNKLSIAYDHAGEEQKALELDKKIYALRLKVSGAEHPETLISLGNLAYSYGKVRNYSKEVELRERVYALMVNVHGQAHSDTVKALEKLQIAQKRAIEMYKKQKVCQHCGGEFKGLFRKTCGKCGKTKDY